MTDVVRLGVVDSTNAAIRRMHTEISAEHPTLVVARGQTAGRGTAGRHWISPEDAGLYFSLNDPQIRMNSKPTSAFTQAAGVACCEVIAERGYAIQLRGVNDLYIGDRKLGGILTEASIQATRMIGLITGVGLNLRQHPATTGNAALAATSLDVHEGRIESPSVLSLALAERIVMWNALVITGPTEQLADSVDRWRQSS